MLLVMMLMPSAPNSGCARWAMPFQHPGAPGALTSADPFIAGSRNAALLRRLLRVATGGRGSRARAEASYWCTTSGAADHIPTADCLIFVIGDAASASAGQRTGRPAALGCWPNTVAMIFPSRCSEAAGGVRQGESLAE